MAVATGRAEPRSEAVARKFCQKVKQKSHQMAD